MELQNFKVISVLEEKCTVTCLYCTNTYETKLSTIKRQCKHCGNYEGCKDIFSNREERFPICYDGVHTTNRYEITKNGEIYTHALPFKKANLTQENGYYYICMQINGKKKYFPLHRILMYTFNNRKGSKNLLVRHLNDIGADNRLDNLAWGTNGQNKKDFHKNQKILETTVKKGYQLGLSVDELSRLTNKPAIDVEYLIKKA